MNSLPLLSSGSIDIKSVIAMCANLSGLPHIALMISRHSLDVNGELEVPTLWDIALCRQTLVETYGGHVKIIEALTDSIELSVSCPVKGEISIRIENDEYMNLSCISVGNN